MAHTSSVSARRDSRLKRIVQQNRRNLVAVILAPLLIFTGYRLRVLNAFGIGDWIGRHYFSLVSTADRPMSDDIRLVYIQEKDPELGDLRTDLMWERARARHAELIRNLEKAGASIIAFDLFFERPMQDQVAQAGTVELVRAVREINARAETRVIVGHISKPGKSVMDSLPSETWGDVDVVDEESNDSEHLVQSAVIVLSQGMHIENRTQEVPLLPAPLALDLPPRN